MTDRRTITLIVAGLAVYGLLALIGAIALAYAKKPVPGELWQASGVAIGALAALLAHTATGANNTTATDPAPAPDGP